MLVELCPTIFPLENLGLALVVLESHIIARVCIIQRRIFIPASSLICLLTLSFEHSIRLIYSILACQCCPDLDRRGSQSCYIGAIPSNRYDVG